MLVFIRGHLTKHLCFPSPLLTLCLLFPHFILTPKGKKEVSVYHGYIFGPSSWEGGRRSHRSHGSLWWSFYDQVGCKSLLWILRFWLHRLKLSRWKTQTGMLLVQRVARYMLKVKARTHTHTRVHTHAVHTHSILIDPSLTSTQPKQARRAWSWIKINMGK